METGLTFQQILTELTRSPHRDLTAYTPVGVQAAQQDLEVFSHLVAWNHRKGEIRDAKAALPILALRQAFNPTGGGNRVYLENALAHLADLNPKLLVRALDYGKTIGAPKNLLQRFVLRYLRDLEGDPREWETTALQHQVSIRRLYMRYHIPSTELTRSLLPNMFLPGTREKATRKSTGKFAMVRQIPTMSPLEIAGLIDRYKLPWLIVRGALGARAKEPDILMAIISRMTAGDLATSAKWLIRAGVKDHPQTRAAFEEALAKAGKRGKAKGTTLKAGKAAKAIKADLGEEKLAGKLQALQERQLDHLKTIQGRWAVLGDKSSSMATAIGTAKQVAALLARLVQDEVHLIFFDQGPRYVGNVQGKSLEAIEMTTAAITASGGTSPGAALQYLLERRIVVDGIAIVSDGGERHAPDFQSVYRAYEKTLGVSPTIYLYEVDGHDPNFLLARCQMAGIQVEHFNLRGRAVDSYSLPDLAQTMRVGRYSLLDEVMAMPLRSMDEILVRTTGMEVIGGRPRSRA